MLHFLLIILALLAIWKLLSHSSINGATLLTGLRRIALVLAIAGAALGGFIGSDSTNPNDAGAAIFGAAIGFGVVWIAAAVVIWIIRGFLTP
jgi:hypothetical protein